MRILMHAVAGLLAANAMRHTGATREIDACFCVITICGSVYYSVRQAIRDEREDAEKAGKAK